MPSPDIDIQVDQRQLRGVEQMLVNIPRGFPKVVSRAINKIAISTRKKIVDKITSELNIGKGELKKRNMKLLKASYTKWGALLTIFGRRIPLIKFITKKQIAAGGLKRGISYKIGKKGGTTRIRHGFLARARFDRMGAYVRAEEGGKRVGRLPIMELHGPSVPEVFDNIQEFSKALLERDIAAKLAKELDTQVGVLVMQEAAK